LLWAVAAADPFVFSPTHLTIRVGTDLMTFHPVPMAVRVARDPYLSLSDPAVVALLARLKASIQVSSDTVTSALGSWDVNSGRGQIAGQGLFDPAGALPHNGEVVLSLSCFCQLVGLTLAPVGDGDYQLVSTITGVAQTPGPGGESLAVSGVGPLPWRPLPNPDGTWALLFDNTACRLPDRTVLAGVTVEVVSRGGATAPTRLQLTFNPTWQHAVEAERVVLIPPVAMSTPVIGTGNGVIVIDAGHGGSDPGAISPFSGVMEKTVTLDIAKALQKDLETAGWRVLMTRSDDRDLSWAGSPNDVELGMRTAVASAPGVDLFVSIHCNASLNTGAQGTTIHWNKSIDYPLAQMLAQDLGAAPVQSPFYVLRHTTVPAVLIETAYITNPQEGAELAQPDFQERLAATIAASLNRYLHQRMAR
jgi:N-acetylmuramoyl-L-alanine amidase